MFGLGLLEIALLLILLLVLLVVLPERALRYVGRSVTVRREWRLVQVTRVVGLVLGYLAASRVPSTDESGAPLALPTFGLVVLAFVALGETLVRPSSPRGLRRASLRPRRVRDYVPVRLGTAIAGVVLATVSVWVASLALLAPSGESSRLQPRWCPPARGTETELGLAPVSATTPALAAVLVGVLLVAAIASRQVVRRPRGMAEQEVDDDALRRRSLAVITAATGLPMSLTYVGLVMTLLGAISNAPARGCDVPAWYPVLEWLAFTTVVVALGIALYCLLELLVGRAARPYRRPTSRV